MSAAVILARPAHEPVAIAIVGKERGSSRMKITFKLFATLTDYLPAARKYNAIDLDVAPETTIDDLVERFQVPKKLVHLVLINGVYILPEARATRTLVEGDVLAIWPPVAGG
jgi:molybdopterin converting factor small subunit